MTALWPTISRRASTSAESAATSRRSCEARSAFLTLTSTRSRPERLLEEVGRARA